MALTIARRTRDIWQLNQDTGLRSLQGRSIRVRLRHHIGDSVVIVRGAAPGFVRH
jgi:hypothetical protein